MKNSVKLLAVIGIIILSIGLVWGGMYWSSNNTEITLNEKVKAQLQVREAFFDAMWKIINQKAQVAEQYKESFKEIYPKLIEGRYGDEKGGTLMKWITESNPTFDISLYKDLSASIEAERKGFFMEQKKLIDINREYVTFKKKIPASWFVGDRPDVEFIIIESDKTKEVFKTGVENDVQLFDKKRPA